MRRREGIGEVSISGNEYANVSALLCKLFIILSSETNRKKKKKKKGKSTRMEITQIVSLLCVENTSNLNKKRYSENKA